MIKLYVGNLPFTATENELSELFGRHGAVNSVKIVTDRETGRSRGFAFVEFERREDGEAAMQALHETPMGGRPLTVNEARPQEKRGFGGGGGGGGGRGGRGGYDDDRGGRDDRRGGGHRW